MNYDVVIIGGGIIGLATAKSLKKLDPKLAVAVFEKEPNLGAFASGKNSGVIHSGFYYTPDSLKAKFCKTGNEDLKQLISKHDIPILNCGKVVVTRSGSEIPQLEKLFLRGLENGIQLELREEKDLVKVEPFAKTKSFFLWSPNTSVSDPNLVLQALAKECRDLGIEILLNSKISIDKAEMLSNHGVKIFSKWIINCSGARSLNMAHRFQVGAKYSQMPFLGTYLYADLKSLPLQTLVYPVPHPVNPFLGVHFTLSTSGRIKIGPTAIPIINPEHNGFSRMHVINDLNNFARSSIALTKSKNHNLSSLTFNDVAKINKNVLIRNASLLVPKVRDVKNWKRYPSATRAQLVDLENGKLEQDFVVEHSINSTHVLNAVSPGWTSAMPFGDYIAHQVIDRLSSTN
jgi:L-2-hydroxyglutarate oxidase LhgO